jgi:predicted nucleic acid-binding protein
VLSRPEIRRHLPRISDLIVNAFLIKLEAKAIPIANVPEAYHYERDPDDEMYLNLAIVANATFLVSQDRDLLDLMRSSSEVAREFRNRYPFLRIMRSADFVIEIESRKSGSDLS